MTNGRITFTVQSIWAAVAAALLAAVGIGLILSECGLIFEPSDAPPSALVIGVGAFMAILFSIMGALVAQWASWDGEFLHIGKYFGLVRRSYRIEEITQVELIPLQRPKGLSGTRGAEIHLRFSDGLTMKVDSATWNFKKLWSLLEGLSASSPESGSS